MTITGLILAGGAGSRMGGADKGWVQWRGRPLVEQVIERLRPQVDALLISANRSLERYRALGIPVITDLDAAACDMPTRHQGPLAGLRAGLRVAAEGQIAVVPCDAPLLPPDLVARLRGAAGADAAVAEVAGRIEPLFCVVPTRLRDALETAYARGERSPAAWLATVGAARVAFADRRAFVNLNAPADLATADAASDSPR